MKKLLSILLCAALLLPCLPLCIHAADESIPFIVASDLHYIPTPKKASVTFPGEKYYCADIANPLVTESSAIVKQFLREAAASDAEFVLLCGDLVDNGYASEHRSIAGLLRTFERDSGKKVFVIDGNHDFTAGISVQDFKTYYSDFGYAEALEVDAETCSYTAELTDGYRLLAIDSCTHIDGRDGIKPELLAWVDTQVQQAKRDGKKLIAIMHHNFLDHVTLQSKLMSNSITDPAKDMQTHFLDWGIRYVFTGHMHGHDIKAYTDKAGRKVYDILTTSLTGYPCGYRTLTLQNDGLDIKTVRIQTVRKADLPQSGYTQELLDELTNDLQTFADGCFHTAFNNILKNNYFSEEALRRILTRFGGAKFQNVVDAILPSFYAYLSLPIYAKDAGEDGKSLQAIAEKFGLQLRQTDDRFFTDPLYYFITVMYDGDENVDYNDDRIMLFMQCVYTAMYSAMQDVHVDQRKAILSDFHANFSSAALPYAVSGIGKAALAGVKDDALLEGALLFAAPVIELFSKDNDDTADNDVFLPDRDDKPVTAGQTVLQFLRKLWSFITQYVTGWHSIISHRLLKK